MEIFFRAFIFDFLILCAAVSVSIQPIFNFSCAGDFIHTIRKPRPGCTEEERHDVSVCVTSDGEEFKCQDYSRAAEARGMFPNIRCVRAASKVACMETLKNNNAHLVVLDGGDIYKGGRYISLDCLKKSLIESKSVMVKPSSLIRSTGNCSGPFVQFGIQW